MTLPVETSNTPPAPFGAGGQEAPPERFLGRIRRTIIAGCVVGGLFVVGAGGWAALTPVAGAITAVGTIKVEGNRKTIKHLESGVVQQILVHEGDHVARGQLLFVFDETQLKAQRDELQSAYDDALASQARFEAEAANRAGITFPAELLARRQDPTVSTLIQTQQALFIARRAALNSQVEIGRQRVVELDNQIDGMKAQVAAINAQLGYNADEMKGVQTLFAGGYAPKTRLLALQRSGASLEGNKGEQIANIARAQQSIGETRTQILATQQAHTAEAAAGLQESGAKLADLGPRLAAARDALSHSHVYAPTDGTVFNLTQFTEGGVAGAGEPLMDIVPSDEPLVIQAQIQPKDVHAVRPGQKALITLTAYNTRTTPRIEAVVSTISADQIQDPHSGKPYFTAELKIAPSELKRLKPDVKIYPGMPVSANIVNGERTIMQYLISPLRDAMSQSLHEQ